MSAADLTTLANVKDWLNVQGSTDDVRLQRLLTASSVFIQRWLNRWIASQSYSDVFDGQGNDMIIFPNYPVSSVQSLSIDTISIPASSDGGILQSGYGFDSDRLWVIGYQFGRNSFVNDFLRGRGNVRCTYTAGFLVGASNPNTGEGLYPADIFAIPGTPYRVFHSAGMLIAAFPIRAVRH